jgi:hypothetical protein
MRKIVSALAFSILIASFSIHAAAQCKGFAKKVCKVSLVPYIHDGNYHAAILTEGEEAELYKTFYADQQYRIAVCGSSDALPAVEFKVIDAERNVLFDNTKQKMVQTWDFKLQASQQLKIVVKVPASAQKKSEAEILSGCVAIMFGFKE